jgi:hypothetical protein
MASAVSLSRRRVTPSTRTVIVSTNMDFDLDRLFAGLPVCTNAHAPLGRAFAGLRHGGITHVDYRQRVRGVPWKQNPRRGKRAQHFFLNSLTLVMLLDASLYPTGTGTGSWKRINAKISHNGRFQLTGCQTDAQFKDFMEAMLAILTDPLGQVLDLPLVRSVRPQAHEGCARGPGCASCIVCTFAVVMCNTDDHLGFQINRERLDTFINARTDFVSIYETSVNTSVNIKLPCTNPHEAYMLRLVWPRDPERAPEAGDLPVQDAGDQGVTACIDEYAETLYPSGGQGGDGHPALWQRKEYPAYVDEWCGGASAQIKWKRAYHTFLVFTSGAVIQSSKGQDAPAAFTRLVGTLRAHRREIEEGRTG